MWSLQLRVVPPILPLSFSELRWGYGGRVSRVGIVVRRPDERSLPVVGVLAQSLNQFVSGVSVESMDQTGSHLPTASCRSMLAFETA